MTISYRIFLAARCYASNSGKLMTLVVGKRRRLLFTEDDDEVFMTKSLNITRKTTEQYAVTNLKPK